MRRRTFAAPVLRALLALLSLTAIPRSVAAQPVVRGSYEIDFDRPEAWAMKYFAAVTLPGTFGAPESLRAGQLDIAVEYGQIPALSESERRVGFNGTKVEDLNKVPYFVRPLLRIGVGKRLTLSAGYIPPVERNGAEASLFSLGIARPLLETDHWRLGLGLRGQKGTVRGDFTCSEQTVAAGLDPIRNPYRCEAVSDDEYEVASLGLEISAERRLGRAGQWRPYAAIAWDHMDLEFGVHSRHSGLDDRTRLLTDGGIWSLTGGIAYRLGAKWDLAGEIHYSPLDVVRPSPSGSTRTDELVNARALLRYRFD